MTDRGMSESVVEQAALAWLEGRGYTIRHGPDLGPGEPGQAGGERRDYTQVVLEDRLRQALARLNPHLPVEATEEPCAG